MQAFAIILSCLALFAGTQACYDNVDRVDLCSVEFERKANQLLPHVEAGRVHYTAICPLAKELEQCLLEVVDNLCDDFTRRMLRPFVTDMLRAATEEASCQFMARRDPQRLVSRSLALAANMASLTATETARHKA